MILYTNDFDIETEEQIKAEYIEEYGEPISESDLYGYINSIDEINAEEFVSDLTKFFDTNGNHGFIVFGSIGRWNGTINGWETFDGMKDWYNANLLKDCDYVEWSTDKGHLYCNGTHHDGSVSYEIRELTKAGRNLIDNWRYDFDDKRTEDEIGKLVCTCNLFSKLPHWERRWA